MPRPRVGRVIGLLIALACANAPASAESDARRDPDGLRLASVHAAVADLDNGRVLYRKFERAVVPIASLTKLMTAMVVIDSGEPMDEWLTVVERRREAPNNAYTRMRIGSKLARGDLLRLALMASENHAAHVLARHHPGGVDAFVRAMNDKADRLGMKDTRFVGPSGLNSANRATAADLLAMVGAAHDYDRIREYTQTRHFTARFRSPRYNVYYSNTNVLIYRDHWDVQLSKTGYLNEAGRCLAMITELDGRTVAMVLLNSFGTRTPVGDAGRIKRWLATGDSGSAARAAMRYERRQRRKFEQALTANTEPAMGSAEAKCSGSASC